MQRDAESILNAADKERASEYAAAAIALAALAWPLARVPAGSANQQTHGYSARVPLGHEINRPPRTRAI